MGISPPLKLNYQYHHHLHHRCNNVENFLGSGFVLAQCLIALPLNLGVLEVEERLLVPKMCMYSAFLLLIPCLLILKFDT